MVLSPLARCIRGRNRLMERTAASGPGASSFQSSRCRPIPVFSKFPESRCVLKHSYTCYDTHCLPFGNLSHKEKGESK